MRVKGSLSVWRGQTQPVKAGGKKGFRWTEVALLSCPSPECVPSLSPTHRPLYSGPAPPWGLTRASCPLRHEAHLSMAHTDREPRGSL